MSAWLQNRNSNLSTFNAIAINYSTLAGSTINSSTINASTSVDSTITTRNLNYSTMIGSTITTRSVAFSTLVGSTLTAGNTGIGTSSPYGKLHVLLTNAPTAPQGNTWTSGWAVFGDNTSGAHSSNSTAAANGNGVGIAFNLTANATLPAGGLLYSIAPNVVWNPMNYNAANHNFLINGSLTPALTIASNGNVGIGTINATGTLQLTSTYPQTGIWPGPTLNFQFNTGSGGYWMAGAIIGYLASNNGSTGGYPGGLAFQTKNPDDVIGSTPTTKMVIDSNGNVGIGTNNPGSKLTVNGVIEIIGGGILYPYANALVMACTSAAGIYFQVPGVNMGIWTASNFTINTGLSVAGSKSFCIPHPVKEKRDNGHVLYHCSLETPNNGDTLQRFQITTINLAYTIVMPDYYYNLCKNIMVSISSVDTFGQSKYNIVSDAVTETVTININVSHDGMYNVFIYGERKDAEIQKSKFQVEKHEPHKIQEIKKNCAPDRPCMYCDSCTNALSNS